MVSGIGQIYKDPYNVPPGGPTGPAAPVPGIRYNPTSSNTHISNPFNSTQTLANPTSAAETFSTIRGTLGQPNQIEVGSTFNAFKEKGPENIKGLISDYFNFERDKRKEALRNEFFGPLGVLNQKASEESGAGRLGSGVSKKIIEQTVMNPFAQQYTNIDRDVGQAEMQEIARVDQINADRQDNFRNFLGTLAQTDSSNFMQAQIANNEILARYDTLAATLASDEAKQMNEFELRNLEAQIDAWAKAEQLKLDEQRNKLEDKRINLEYT